MSTSVECERESYSSCLASFNLSLRSITLTDLNIGKQNAPM